MITDFAAARAFVAVASAGGFRDASVATGISASSLSGAVKRLESQLGVRLLHRTTRSVVTTEAGAHLLEHLQAAMVDVEAALNSASDLDPLAIDPAETVGEEAGDHWPNILRSAYTTKRSMRG